MYKAIIIDEFQDTSAMQYNLLRILASHNRITIVGDDDQVCPHDFGFQISTILASNYKTFMFLHYLELNPRTCAAVNIQF